MSVDSTFYVSPTVRRQANHAETTSATVSPASADASPLAEIAPDSGAPPPERTSNSRDEPTAIGGEAVAGFDAARVEKMGTDPRGIPNPHKVAAVVANAQAALTLGEHGFRYVGPGSVFATLQAVGSLDPGALPTRSSARSGDAKEPSTA